MRGILSGLNEEQRKAVTLTEGFVRVVAGAGSGKTRALSHRFAYLVQEAGILPGNILCVTFTNKSAGEMRARIRNLTGDNDTGFICTFHSFCVSVLREESFAVQYPQRFFVIDNEDIDTMLQTVYEERGLTLRHMPFSKARDMIEIRKVFTEPRYYLDMVAMSLEALKEKYLAAKQPDDIIFYGYLYQEKKCFALDYNDLIRFTLHIFNQNETIRLKWQRRIEYIMIDEFQDIDELQYELMSVLCGYHKNLFVVGDPDQTVYSWRGANAKYFMEFDKAFPSCTTIMMTKNYRSTPQILGTANSLISKNAGRIKKDLAPVLPDGADVVFYHGDTAEKEAEWIAGKIHSLVKSGVPHKDIAVLYRAHYVTRTLESVFFKKKIPYRIYGGVQFFARREIKDALCYMRMAVYKDDISFLRTANTPKRNIGEKRMSFLRAYAEQNGCPLYRALEENVGTELFAGTKADEFLRLTEELAKDARGKSVSEFLADVLDKSGYEKMLRTEGAQNRLDNLAELRQSVYEYENACGEECSVEDYLARVALFSPADGIQAQDAVKLMTVHTAKGLEFPHVFLCNLCEGIFPSAKIKTLDEMEEERRLAFVAVTRAEKSLFLSDNEGRNFDGSVRLPSRFILDIDKKYVVFERELPEQLVARLTACCDLSMEIMSHASHEAGFRPGDRVRHRIFGDGTVRGADKENRVYDIQFDGMATLRKISFRIPLEKL